MPRAPSGNTPLGQVLRVKGWSCARLAEATGLSFASVQRYARGERDPRGATVARMAKALGVDARTLLPESAP